MKRLEGKVVIITGGASGIGEAAARKFAGEGARLVLADLQEQKGRDLARTLGGEAVFQMADVCSEADVQELVALAVRRFGRLDCMYNNAGFGCGTRPVADTPMGEFDRQVAVLLRGTFLGIKHAAAVMQGQKSGVIVNTASVAALGGGYANHAYSAAKAGVVSLTRTTALELGESGIRVNCLCPGSIATPIFVHGLVLNDEEREQAVATIAASLGHNALGRCGTAEDVANAALWLASDESSFVNGQAIVVDGGLTSGIMWSDMRAASSRLFGNLSRQFPAAFPAPAGQ
jgi:NAD(P)-dependent dehydrogenase (short-subunit alcohol dehydrogenase family)